MQLLALDHPVPSPVPSLPSSFAYTAQGLQAVVVVLGQALLQPATLPDRPDSVKGRTGATHTDMDTSPGMDAFWSVFIGYRQRHPL